ncbi:MAG: amino acid permease [Nocardioidaceae bacterium]
MVGFEDSVNMAEECHSSRRDFPPMMLTGLGITGVIYVLVSITAVALVPVGNLRDESKGSALLQVVAAGAPGLPFDTIFPSIGMFAEANSALINRLMASRLLYDLANQDVLPHALICAFLAGPWARSSDQLQQYEMAGYLLAVGVVLWLPTWLWNRGVPAKKTGFREPEQLSG